MFKNLFNKIGSFISSFSQNLFGKKTEPLPKKPFEAPSKVIPLIEALKKTAAQPKDAPKQSKTTIEQVNVENKRRERFQEAPEVISVERIPHSPPITKAAPKAAKPAPTKPEPIKQAKKKTVSDERAEQELAKCVGPRPSRCNITFTSDGF